MSAPSPLATLEPETQATLRRGGRMLRLCLGLYALLTLITMGLWKPIDFTGIDYDKHWFAARALLEGKSVYYGGSLWMGFNYPQAAALPFFWLGYFSVGAGEYVWKFLLLALTLACAGMACRYYRPQRAAEDPAHPTLSLIRAGMTRYWGLTAAFMTSCYFPLTSCLFIGNIDPVNAFCAVAMVAALLAGAPLWAGVFWALLTLVKMMPLALLIPIVAWRQWRVLQGFLAAMLVYFLILVALGRVGEEWYFVREAIPAIPVWWRGISISPIPAFFRSLGLGAWIENPRTFAIVARWSALVLLGLYLLLIRALRRRRLDWLTALEGAIVFYPIFSPLLEYHHFVWILPVFFLQARRFAMGRLGLRTALVLLAGWVLLCATWHFVDLTPQTWIPHVVRHFAALPGYLTILIATLYDLLATQAAPREGESTISKWDLKRSPPS